MPDKQLTWEQVRDVLIKRRKAGQAPHWSMGWVAARIARTDGKRVGKAFKHALLDYYSQHAGEKDDGLKARVWHRLIGFVDALHNADLPEPGETPARASPTAKPEFDPDATLVMEP